MSFNVPKTEKKRVVIVGGGFGGLKLANKLKKSDFQVVLIDRNNYHQFPPLIYQIASAGIEPSSISFPFRKIFQRRRNFYYRMAEVRSIFPEHKIIQTSIGKVHYDYLVLAAGTTTNFFGNKNLEDEAMPMKTVSEAMGLRNAILDNFERALTCATERERQELLNVVIVGGGATGVEIAGALSEMKKFVLPKDYPDLPANLMHVYLIEAADKLLGAMSPATSERVLHYLQEMGVSVLLGKMVTDFKDHKVILKDGSAIATRTFIWVSGVRAQSVGNLDPKFLGRGGRIKVDAYNRVDQVAIQQGNLLAKNLIRMEKGQDLQPFRYRNLGTMATVGRNRAVAEFNNIKMGGFLAWIMWLVVHLRSILGVRNKLMVLINWVWNYFSYGQSLRMIVYARKAKEVREREAWLASTHWGTDLMGEDNPAAAQTQENKTPDSAK